jgi:ATP-binding cassette subfamily F protein 3
MAKASKPKMAQSMQKQLDKLERIEIDDTDTTSMIIRFPPPPRSGEVAAKADHMTKKYGNNTILDNVDFNILRGERVAFVGQNGQGKTTLAKIICGMEPATSGEASLGYNIHLGYYAQNQAETLDPKLTLIETMEKYAPPEMRTKLRSILGAFLFSGQDVDKKVVALSGGERARLALACMLLRPINFLILDEPTNHLDMTSKEVLKQALIDFEGTLLVVSHDREFLSDLTQRTIEFRDHKLIEYLGDINYFLDKRKLDNMRDVEMRTVNGATNGAAKGKELNAEEKKALQRNVQKSEKRIADLEQEIKGIESKMEAADFYMKPEADAVMKKYADLKAELQKEYASWELAVEQIG